MGAKAVAPRLRSRPQWLAPSAARVPARRPTTRTGGAWGHSTLANRYRSPSPASAAPGPALTLRVALVDARSRSRSGRIVVAQCGAAEAFTAWLSPPQPRRRSRRRQGTPVRGRQLLRRTPGRSRQANRYRPNQDRRSKLRHPRGPRNCSSSCCCTEPVSARSWSQGRGTARSVPSCRSSPRHRSAGHWTRYMHPGVHPAWRRFPGRSSHPRCRCLLGRAARATGTIGKSRWYSIHTAAPGRTRTHRIDQAR